MTKNNNWKNIRRANTIKYQVWKCYENELTLQEIIIKLSPLLLTLKRHYELVFCTKYFKDLGYTNEQLDLTGFSDEDLYSEFCHISDRIMAPNRLNFLIQLLKHKGN